MTHRLWAGWRIPYLEPEGPSSAEGGDCVFCGLLEPLIVRLEMVTSFAESAISM